MDIHQLQASYQMEQDRILLRLNTRSQEEFRLWLTRRMVKGFLPHLVQFVAQINVDTSQAISHDSGAPQGLAHFIQQESVALADYATPFAGPSASQPEKAEPLLVTKVHITMLGEAGVRLGFEEQMAGAEATRSFEVTLALPVVHNLLHLIEMVMAHADWDIPTAGTHAEESMSGFGDFANAKPPTYLN